MSANVARRHFCPPILSGSHTEFFLFSNDLALATTMRSNPASGLKGRMPHVAFATKIVQNRDLWRERATRAAPDNTAREQHRLVGHITLMLFSAFMESIDFPLSQYLGRIGLSKAPAPGEELVIYRDGQNISRTLPPASQYMATIAEQFGINLNADYEDFAPLIPS